MAIWRASQPPVRLPETFTEAPQDKPTTSTTVATENDNGDEMGPTTILSIVPNVVPISINIACMIYLSVKSISTLVQRQVRTES